MARWAFWLMTIGLAQALTAAPLAARDTIPHRSFATVTDRTSVPYGWVDFCARYDGACEGPRLPARDIELTAKAWKAILALNTSVNRAIQPVSDLDHWGVIDRWDYPTDGKGDCEDYALWKRKLLIDAGYPRQALLMTVVKDHAGEGHAILTVKTDRGEFVLDNMTDAVLAWDQTGYRFVKRQSQEDANVWLTIAPTTAAPLYTAR